MRTSVIYEGADEIADHQSDVVRQTLSKSEADGARLCRCRARAPRRARPIVGHRGHRAAACEGVGTGSAFVSRVHALQVPLPLLLALSLPLAEGGGTGRDGQRRRGGGSLSLVGQGGERGRVRLGREPGVHDLFHLLNLWHLRLSFKRLQQLVDFVAALVQDA